MAFIHPPPELCGELFMIRGRPIIGADIKHFTDIGRFQNRFADNNFFNNFFLCKQTYYLQVTLFIGE